MDRTLMIIKPDGLRRGMVGEIIKKIEKMGGKLVYAKMMWPDSEKIKGNYPGTEKWLSNIGNKTLKNYKDKLSIIEKTFNSTDPIKVGEKIFQSLVEYLSSSPMVFLVWEGHQIIERVRKATGDTIPIEANVGSIRGDFGFDTPILAVSEGRLVFENLVHASDSKNEADREIEFWLGKDFDFVKYRRDYER